MIENAIVLRLLPLDDESIAQTGSASITTNAYLGVSMNILRKIISNYLHEASDRYLRRIGLSYLHKTAHHDRFRKLGQTMFSRPSRPALVRMTTCIFLTHACLLGASSAGAQTSSCAAGEIETFFTSTPSVQSYTVPNGSSSLRIIAAGAQGGGVTGGLGALIDSQFSVVQGQTFAVIVGEQPVTPGAAFSFGGGGGTFVGSPGFIYSTTTPELYLAAGGGGGGSQGILAGNAGVPGQDGQPGTSSNSGNTQARGGLASGDLPTPQNNAGGGGALPDSTPPPELGGACGGAGAGGDGGTTGNSAFAAHAAIHGGAGSPASASVTKGGFGGGGCAIPAGSGSSGGGGGGFAGGEGGIDFGDTGGGGSSFVRSDGRNVSASVTQTGNGFARFCATVTPPALSIVKVASTADYSQGTATGLIYTLTVTNSSAANATGVSVQDVPPAGVTFTSWTAPSCTPASGSGAVDVHCDVAAQGSVTVSILATIAANVVGNVSNTATIVPPTGAACVAPSANCSSTAVVAPALVPATPVPTPTLKPLMMFLLIGALPFLAMRRLGKAGR